MAKRKVFSLSNDDVLSPYDEMLENTAVLSWNTSYTAFSFAFYLNHLYGLNLQRRDDITLSTMKETITCSVFSCNDGVNHQSFFLIENGMTAMQKVQKMSYFDKTLLIQGPDAFEIADGIYNDMLRPHSNAVDIIGMQREEMRLDFVNTGIVETVKFDFSDHNNPTSSLIKPGIPASSKQKKFHEFQKEYIQGILVEIDDLIEEE